MRKLILAGLAAAALVPTLAQAQSAGELRHDQRDIHDQRRDVRDAIRDGDPRAQVRDQREDVRQARQEYHEDWRDYRRAHPDNYRGQRWVGPRGYGYRPVRAGYRFRPEFYDRRYWVDPYRYHLRPVYGTQRWVRYGNDVLLIDTRSGQVLEVNGGFFF